MCWGDNIDGALGNGSTSATPVTLPVAVTVGSMGEDIVSLAAGTQMTCAVAGGNVYCWGLNSVGQLGNGSTVNSSTPVEVSSVDASGAVQVAAGNGFACALYSSGNVYCWGDNTYGELGDGAWTTQWTPQLVTGAQSWASIGIEADGNTACAANVAAAGYCWGYNKHSQVGSNGGTNENQPTVVTFGVTNNMVGGYWFSCGLTLGSGGDCWGANPDGQLGNGTVNWSTGPVGITSVPTGALALTLGNSHACVATYMGTVWCWGYNYYGQLGNNSTTNSDVPIVSDLGGRAVVVAAGGMSTCAATAGGEVFCWGYNVSGQLGNGTVVSSSLPVVVKL